MADPTALIGRDLTEAEAAAALRIHPKTLARWRRSGAVAHYVSPGGRIGYRFEDLVALRATMRVLPCAPKCSNMSGEPESAAA